MAPLHPSRVMLKLGKEAVGHCLATDVLSSDGLVLVPKGTVLDEVAVQKLLAQDITIIIIEPEGTNKAKATLDHMFAPHLDDPYMDKLHKAAISVVEPKGER